MAHQKYSCPLPKPKEPDYFIRPHKPRFATESTSPRNPYPFVEAAKGANLYCRITGGLEGRYWGMTTATLTPAVP